MRFYYHLKMGPMMQKGDVETQTLWLDVSPVKKLPSEWHHVKDDTPEVVRWNMEIERNPKIHELPMPVKMYASRQFIDLDNPDAYFKQWAYTEDVWGKESK